VGPADSIRQWYNKRSVLMPGTLFVVATPIGNLEDISTRALRVLKTVEVIAAEDTRRTAHLLARYGISTPTTSFHEHNERTKTSRLLGRLQAGESIALVTDAGTPGVSDPGARLAAAAIDAGLKVEPIPGPSAVLALLSVCGFPVSSFTFLGFPPTRSSDRSRWFEAVRSAGRPVVFFEAPHRIRATLEDLLQTMGDVRVAVGRELTKSHEELVVRPISQVLSGELRAQGEFTVAIEIGLSAKSERSVIDTAASGVPPTGNQAQSICTEFGQLTESGVMSRREALTLLAKRHGLSSRQVYSVIETAKRTARK
jgi:16S rRNA (cytidine1402-2'-O)-methyltransferase